MAKYWRKDIAGQEEGFEGHPLEILFMVQVLEQKDYGVELIDDKMVGVWLDDGEEDGEAAGEEDSDYEDEM